MPFGIGKEFVDKIAQVFTDALFTESEDCKFSCLGFFTSSHTSHKKRDIIIFTVLAKSSSA
jgi:hypothetical protein